MPSIIALAPGFNFMIFLAQNTPRKKAIMVATTPVFMEIHNGVQFISLRNCSHIILLYPQLPLLSLQRHRQPGHHQPFSSVT